jgi:hypothetical protein
MEELKKIHDKQELALQNKGITDLMSELDTMEQFLKQKTQQGTAGAGSTIANKGSLQQKVGLITLQVKTERADVKCVLSSLFAYP